MSAEAGSWAGFSEDGGRSQPAETRHRKWKCLHTAGKTSALLLPATSACSICIKDKQIPTNRASSVSCRERPPSPTFCQTEEMKTHRSPTDLSLYCCYIKPIIDGLCVRARVCVGVFVCALRECHLNKAWIISLEGLSSWGPFHMKICLPYTHVHPSTHTHTRHLSPSVMSLSSHQQLCTQNI